MGASVSIVPKRRWIAHSSFCSSRMTPTSRVTAASAVSNKAASLGTRGRSRSATDHHCFWAASVSAMAVRSRRQPTILATVGRRV